MGMDDADGAVLALTARIVALSYARGMSQQDLGSALGIVQPQVSKRMRGIVQWRYIDLVRLARVLGVTVPQLTDLEGPLPGCSEGQPATSRLAACDARRGRGRQ